jgi:hypothetical protein
LRSRKEIAVLHRDDPCFEAWLPGLTRSTRIASLHEATVFARRWVIRDKDLALKALVRRLERARGSEAAARALRAFHQALASRNLLSPPGATGLT